ncbi:MULTISPECIES: Xaa-Pro peptidase family protein [Streptacidiphilus]|uniref:M24 family metallopeptidase n=1 Tax=Streptacidiphilus cavernicola TaxID=3342716 RepID=A0ABV6UT90_9ACTN|nr:aminopeptidase P family protein [Streptacidiphilus jeojiense]
MAEVHAERRDRMRERSSAAGLDAALVTRPANVRWLTGSDSVAALLLTRDGAEAAAAGPTGPPESDGGCTVLPVPAGTDPAVLLAARCRARTLGVEEHDLTVARHRAVAAAAPGVEQLRDLGRAVEQLRTVKDEEEISCLRIAGEIADQALGELLESILVGRTERHLAMELERRMIDHGADSAAFPTRVGSGDHSGRADHSSGDRRVEDGDFLTVALGACYRGYRTAATRTFVVGLSPADWQSDLHRQVFAAQRAAREALTVGGGYDEADRAARRVLGAAGQPAPDEAEPAAREGVGAGVGLEIGEEPRLGPLELGKLDNRVPVTVGVGVCIPGRGGVRIEDTLVVRPSEDGGPELLTITTKELLAL